jgi:hypothetical protein
MPVVVRLLTLAAVVAIEMYTGLSYRMEWFNLWVPAIVLELLQSRKYVREALRPPAVFGCGHPVFLVYATPRMSNINVQGQVASRWAYPSQHRHGRDCHTMSAVVEGVRATGGA